MADVYMYLKRHGARTIHEAAFCEVDGMILSRLSYAPLELLPPPGAYGPYTIGEAAGRLLTMPDLTDKLLWKEELRLLQALRDSRRFREMKLSSWIGERDERTQTQFFAVLIQLRESESFLAFRGTDDTLVGWKENFNMGFLCPVPAQELAVCYLEQAAGRQKGRFRLGGHSKGGNLAIYAAAFCAPAVQARIDAVYNYDGPGFRKEVVNAPGYERVRGRINTFVPQGSIVGMLLSRGEEQTIVRSTQVNGVFQHDVYSWEIAGRQFVRLEHVTSVSRWIELTLQDWITRMTQEERKCLVDTLYDIARETDAKTLTELGKNWPESMTRVLHAVQGLDEPTRRAVADAFSLLGRSAAKGGAAVIRQEARKGEAVREEGRGASTRPHLTGPGA